ncbi:MAG: 16S rRNA (cytidine(1402)-2'-O)-methyltransferase, partial [Deltaproteobacteria bacterium]|nr:16S rRNA (cytidine(1402)-2'-O)-methyltransferase [Deltaproteobacteria bacterium]
FTFVGFLPDKPGKRRKAIEGFKDYDHTVVLYVSLWKVEKTIKDCLDILGDRGACLCRELTKIHEEFVRDKLSGLLKRVGEKRPKGEMLLILEPAPLD